MQTVKWNVGCEIFSLQRCSCRMRSCNLQSHFKNSCCPVDVSPSAGTQSGEANGTWIPWVKTLHRNSDYTQKILASLRLANTSEHPPWQPRAVPEWCWSLFCVCCRRTSVSSLVLWGVSDAFGHWATGDWPSQACTGLNTQHLCSRKHFHPCASWRQSGRHRAPHVGPCPVSRDRTLGKGYREQKHTCPSPWWASHSPGVWLIWGWTCLLQF